MKKRIPGDCLKDLNKLELYDDNSNCADVFKIFNRQKIIDEVASIVLKIK